MDVEDYLKEIGIAARDVSIYRTALTHRSAGPINNERMEFLGDTVLATAVSKYLMDRYPGSDEGFLTRVRSKLVRGTTQTMIAERIGLRARVSMAERAEGKRSDDSVAEDAFEALIGALFLDRGFDACYEWISRVYEANVDFADAVREHVTQRETLEGTARRRGETLSFDHSRMIGDRHKTIVRLSGGVYPAGAIVGVGEADTKKAATEEACRRANRHIV